MSARTILFFLEPLLVPTTDSIVMIFSSRQLLACLWIMILAAVFLSTGPTPCTTTARSNDKSLTNIQSARKNIGAGIVLQAPALTPRAALRISRSTFGHILKKVKQILIQYFPHLDSRFLFSFPQSLAAHSHRDPLNPYQASIEFHHVPASLL